MIRAIGNNRSLTFYQMPSDRAKSIVSVSFSGGIGSSSIANSSFYTTSVTTGYNNQLNNYLSYNHQTQQDLLKRTQVFMDRVYASNPNPTASALRDKATWSQLKRFVTREELMKLQIGGSADLPLSEEQLADIRVRLADKDLTSMTDREIEEIIDSIVSPNDPQYLAALKEFKATGKASDLLQQSKLDSLKAELDKIDLDHITSDEYKHLKENYVERSEYHHKESISSNPDKQSDADNVDILKTSEHDKRHTHIDENGNEKVNYQKPVKEAPNDRNQDLKDANKRRVIKNELQGLGLAVAIGAGIGLTIGFITTLARSGITPDSVKYAAVEGIKSGVESGVLSAASYGIGRTAGQLASNALSGVLENIGLTITENVSKMINMGVVGALTVVMFSAYQFIKLKLHGVATKEALIQTGKQALFSLSLLAVSIAAQGLWGGPAGIIVSVSVGIILISYSVGDTVHQRHFAERIRVYTIDKCKPCFST